MGFVVENLFVVVVAAVSFGTDSNSLGNSKLDRTLENRLFLQMEQRHFGPFLVAIRLGRVVGPPIA